MRAGILLESLGPSQKSLEITREINQVEKLDDYWDFIVFYTEYDRIYHSPKFAMMNAVECYGFDAPVISTSVETTKILDKCIRPTKKFFYVWDFEWSQSVHNIEELTQVYTNPEIELIARSQEHSDVLESCWKKPIAVIENFDYVGITNLLRKAS